MPYSDVNDAMCDMEFIDKLVCARTTNVVDSGGLNDAGVTITFKFFGVVTADRGSQLDRGDDASRVEGSISIVTKTLLTPSNAQYQADVITWNERQYTVQRVDDYSRYGRGFYQALADLVPITG